LEFDVDENYGYSIAFGALEGIKSIGKREGSGSVQDSRINPS
jgi:hypothetical protein